MNTATRQLRAEDLLAFAGERRCELVKGEIHDMAPAGFGHGAVTMNLSARLAHFVRSNSLGVVVGADTGFILKRNPDTLRAPDIAFVRAERIGSSGLPAAYWEGAPDLAVEVISPNDTMPELDEKVVEYLAAGTQAVWVISPFRKTLTIHRPQGVAQILREEDILDGGTLIPGFRLVIAEIFA